MLEAVEVAGADSGGLAAQGENDRTTPVRPTWEEGVMERKTVSLPEGGRYEGEVNDAGLPHGSGSATWPDGERYRGAWRKGVMDGRGTMLLPDGGRYRGEFADGLPHGQGSMA